VQLPINLAALSTKKTAATSNTIPEQATRGISL